MTAVARADKKRPLKSTPENNYYYDATGKLVMTTHNTSRRTIQHLDGDGRAARQDQYSYCNYQFYLQQTEYY
ncbi:MAG: hypothetical protein LC778_09490 [Acidobacteria bacterium]|nr:hypothetical protein [Acidobacteriota bacterium]